MVAKWTYLLFEEFFEQGDMEKEAGLPVSMLCDRDNTNVRGSQPGFIDFVVMPLYQVMSHFLPKVSSNIANLKSNKAKWLSYEETDEDKEVYKIKGDKNIIM